MPLSLLPLLFMRMGHAQEAPSAPSSPSSLTSELPIGYALDGDLGEWTRPPDILLGAGAAPTGEASVWPDDFALKAWWTMTAEGLVLAAEVHDDKVLLPGPGQDPMFADHVALWVAGTAPDMPGVGFENEQGLQLLRAPADCAALAGDADKCKAWFAAQGPHRTRLAHLFIRQYILAPGGITEVWSGNCRPDPTEDPPIGASACKGSKIAVKTADGGYRLEALIVNAELPATGELPMLGLRMMLEAVDNDEGYERQEELFSSAPKADPNRPTTLPRLTLPAPWFPDSDPPLFAAVETRDPNSGMFYFPARPIRTAYVFENLAQGGQTDPIRVSPEVTTLDWSAPKVVASPWDLRIFEVAGQGRWCAACKVDHRLVALRGEDVVATEDIDDANVKGSVARGDALHLFLVSDAPATPLGGPSAPIRHSLVVKTMDAQGLFDDLFRDEIVEKVPTDVGVTYTNVSTFVATDGASFGFKGMRAESGGAPRPFTRTDRWDAAGEAYVTGADTVGK